MTERTQIERSRRPAPGAIPKVQLPSFERFRLDNGLNVLSIQHDDMPEISARLVLSVGSVEDGRDRAGTALLVARALTEGTSERSASQVAEWLDYLGARFTLDVNHDATTLSLHFLSRVLDGALDFLAEILTKPEFASKEVERLRDERLDEIARGLDEPRIIASLFFNEASFGEHPYGMRTGGIESTVREIDRDVLHGFHQRYYSPDGATLIMVGDLPEVHELRARVGKALAGWVGKPVSGAPLEDPASATERRLWAVPWAGPQSEIRVGGLGIARSDPDYFAVSVMNAILGGLFSSRINMNLREDKGWTYGASSRFDARRRRGPFYAATAVDAKASVAAVREIVTEMERMKIDPATDEEVELAVNALTLSLPRLFETPRQVTGRVVQQVTYDLPDDYWETFAENVRAVSKSDVQRVSKRLLDTDRSAIVVVGPVSDFRSELEKLAKVDLRDIRGNPAEQ
jgi:zinc protease